MERLQDLIRRGVSRRKFLAGVGCSGTAAALTMAGCGSHDNLSTTPTNPTTPAFTDTDILNFALNLEYLEAEFYLRATTGTGLSDTDAGGSNAGAVTGGAQVPFMTPAIQEYAMEIASDELLHVRFLRSALGTAAVPRPTIDLMNSFNTAAMEAGIGNAFNPFASEDAFIVGAFTFEDVGVTAYHGAASLLSSTANLTAAAGIMATEAYHAAEIRTLLAQLGGNYLTYANQISALRAAAGGGNEVAVAGNAIVPADSNSIAFDRTTNQVLNIVYLTPPPGIVKAGGFFPDGLNGTITATTN
jgi:ferritin-like protein